MLPTSTKFFVLALMTCVVTLVPTLAGLHPSMTLSCGPTEAPFGPQSWSGRTPVFVFALKAPITVVGPWTVVGSTISSPPWQGFAPPAPKVQPDGLLAICGTDTKKRSVLGSHAGCSIEAPWPAGIMALSTMILA